MRSIYAMLSTRSLFSCCSTLLSTIRLPPLCSHRPSSSYCTTLPLPTLLTSSSLTNNLPRYSLTQRRRNRTPACAPMAAAPSINKVGNLQPSAPDHVVGNWYSIPGLRLRDHFFTVPLDYNSNEDSTKIKVFAREVVGVGKEELPLPFLLYLQGGPGFESPRPTEAGGWISKACETYRVILLDQRGTGLSTSLTPSSMLQMRSSEHLAEYLKHFRADNIVHDAEFIRVRLVPNAGPWTILGQSFGGFCAVTYLSFAPQGLKHVLMTGGIPPIDDGCTAETVYKACFEQVIQQNMKYYERFPQDAEIVREIIEFLVNSKEGGVRLPSGGLLTPRGLQTVGHSGLGSSGGFERMHYLFERAWDPVIVTGGQKCLSYYFLSAVEKWLPFDTNPLYAILHEVIFCQGASSRWAANRVRSSKHENEFDAVKAAKESRPVYFTGEMVFPWMFDDIPALKHFKDVANLLAEKEDWPPLYDAEQLRNNKVPVAAAVYYEDMYVNFKLSMETASQIAGIRLWVSNEFMHSGLRDSPKVVEQLLDMLNGNKPLF